MRRWLVFVGAALLMGGGVGLAQQSETPQSANLVVSSIAVGPNGNPITKIRVYRAVLTPSQIAAALGAAEQTFPMLGLTVDDVVIVNAPASQTALCPLTSGRASATDELALTFSNLAVALCTPVAGTYTVVAFRSTP